MRTGARYTRWVIRRLHALVSAGLIVTLLCGVGAGALCALPCATQPSHDGTAASVSATDHCASVGAATSDRSVAAATTRCRDHDDAVPAVESHSRRALKAAIGALGPATIVSTGSVVRLSARLFAVPPGVASPLIGVPLRI